MTQLSGSETFFVKAARTKPNKQQALNKGIISPVSPFLIFVNLSLTGEV